MPRRRRGVATRAGRPSRRPRAPGNSLRFAARATAHGAPIARSSVTSAWACPIVTVHRIGSASQPATMRTVRPRPRRQNVRSVAADDDRAPDERGHLVRQERQRAEDDGQQRRVEVGARHLAVRDVDVQRQAGVQSGAGVVVGAGVRQRIGRQVQDRDVDPEEQTQDGEDVRERADRTSERASPGSFLASVRRRRSGPPRPASSVDSW